MRSLLYVPADNQRFIAKAHQRGADAIILDLEDSVGPHNKIAARNGLVSAVQSAGQAGATILVRINAEPELAVEDALAAVHAGAWGLVVPKVRTVDELTRLAASIEPAERQAAVPALSFIALLEDPGAVLDARLIARGPRLIGLAVGSEDLALALGAEPSPAILHFPKLLVHYAAKAQGLLSLGLLRSVADYNDLQSLEQAADEARMHGFDGATCVHPMAVPVLNTAFAVSQLQKEWAQRVVEEAAKHMGAFQLDGSMVDVPVIARARNLLGRAD